MSSFTPQTMRFAQQLQAYHFAVVEYENAQWQREALQRIPVQQLEQRARTAMAETTEAAARLSFRDQCLKQLLHWFKHEFFRWTNQPKCASCQSDTQSIGATAPTAEERQHRAGITELYRCTRCQSITRYPRYNHPLKLLETRNGRCGEWANCFTLLCRAMGYEARAAHDWTDHVWTEVYSEQQRRWVHCDPCEDVMDRPELYEGGWGKKLNYVIAVSRDDVVDVTRRYTKKYDEVKTRRTLCPEAQLQVVVSMMNLSLWHWQPVDRRRVLLERQGVEQRELQGDQAADHVLQTGHLAGRTTGSAEWRRARGEIGDEQKTQAAIVAQHETRTQLQQHGSQPAPATTTAAATPSTSSLPTASSASVKSSASPQAPTAAALSSTPPVSAASAAAAPSSSSSSSAASSSAAASTASSSSAAPTLPADAGKASVKLLFSRYHAQLTKGCGRAGCVNDACRSSERYVAGEDESAAGIASRCLRLTSQFKASKLCENVNKG